MGTTRRRLTKRLESMKEIVTIQVGGFANFVGSHFWNFQDELLGLAGDPHSYPSFKNHSLDMDILYRTGETQQGILTYTPRLVSINFAGALGSTSSYGTLYNNSPCAPSHVATWTGNVSTHVAEPRKKNLFLQSLYEEEQQKSTPLSVTENGNNNYERNIQDKDLVDCLETGVKYWTDFSKVHYHPQTLYEISGLWMDVEEFDNYGIGKDAFAEGSRGEEINERLRFFVEECDHIQGFQFIVDDAGGFSGVATEFLENIADEYPNTPVLLYAVRGTMSEINPRSRKQKIARNLHDSVSFSRLSSFCKLIVPLGLPFLSTSRASTYLRIEDEKPYHCSAVYASGIHSMSLPFRMEQQGPAVVSQYMSGAVDINTIIQMLVGQGRQNMVAILDAAMPAPSLTGKESGQSLLGNLQPLTPEVAEYGEDLQAVECMTIHGALSSGGHQATVSEVKETIHAAYINTTTMPMFSHLSVAPSPLPIPLPFPKIFTDTIGQHGELFKSPKSSVSHPSTKGSLEVHSIPMAARLRSTTAILPFLKNRLENLRKFGTGRGATDTELLRSWGFSRDELEDIGESLSRMVLALDPLPEYTSDSD